MDRPVRPITHRSTALIVGLGFVGNALYHTLNCEKIIYDPDKGFFRETKDVDFIFLCLPTPTIDGKINDSIVLSYLSEYANFKGVIVIKSTMLNVPVMYNVVYNPEFLNQNNSVDDSMNQDVVVLGGHAPAVSAVKQLYRNESTLICPEFVLCTIKEAINIKYYHNIYNAYKALFWNYVNERCDHRMIARVYELLGSNEMSRVASDGKKGYGGACFPKDVAAMNGEYPHELTEFMINYNTKLRQ